MGISDPRKIYFGDQLLSSDALREVAYLGNGFSRVLLPITILEKFDSACNSLRS